MIISKPEITRTDDGMRYAVRIRESARKIPETLWFQTCDPVSEISDKTDAALLAMLMPAMCAGEPIHLQGRVSRRLLAAINGAYQPLLLKVMPTLRTVAVTADAVTDEACGGAGHVATGYSGGVDTFTTLLRPRNQDERPISLLIHNNVGSHGGGERGRSVFRERLARDRQAGVRLSLPVIGIDSNLDDFYAPPLSFISSHTVRNAAAAMTLQGVLSTYEYSSGHTHAQQAKDLPGDIARIDEKALPLLSTECIRMKPSGADYDRVRKLLLVTAAPVTRGLLDVCIQPRRARGRTNCSRCIKCLRAQFFLEFAGRLEDFAESFDLATYRRMRHLQIASMLRGQLGDTDELLQHVLANGFRVPRLSRFYALPVVYQVAKALHRLMAVLR